MIAASLKSDIDRYAAEMEDRNALFAGAIAGRLTADKVGFYLTNVRLLLRHTPVHLERARRRAVAVGDHALAEHFAAKSAEERGHDRWADHDLERLAEELRVVAAGAYASGLLGLLRFLEATIDDDPSLYLAHVLFAEYLIALRGPEWLALIEERCGVPVRMMTAIANHAELDKEHTDEGLDAIDRLVAPRKLAAMRRVLAEVITYFDVFSAQVMAYEGPCVTTSAA